MAIVFRFDFFMRIVSRATDVASYRVERIIFFIFDVGFFYAFFFIVGLGRMGAYVALSEADWLICFDFTYVDAWD